MNVKNQGVSVSLFVCTASGVLIRRRLGSKAPTRIAAASARRRRSTRWKACAVMDRVVGCWGLRSAALRCERIAARRSSAHRPTTADQRSACIGYPAEAMHIIEFYSLKKWQYTIFTKPKILKICSVNAIRWKLCNLQITRVAQVAFLRMQALACKIFYTRRNIKCRCEIKMRPTFASESTLSV